MPSTTRQVRATALPPEERRATIIAATAPLLVEHGPEVTSKQIAEAAGIAEGTVFRVFPDKDAVITATVAALIDPAPLETDLAAISLDLPFEQRLAEAVAVLQERVVTVWQVLSAVGPRYHDTARPLEESPQLVNLIEPDAASLSVGADVAARRLRALTMTLTHPLLTPEPVEPTEIVSMYLHGLVLGGSSCCS